jgi:hypothetical protein
MCTSRPFRPGRLLLAIAVVGTALTASLPLLAQALVTPEQGGPWYRQIQVDAFASASYSYNFNHPANDANDYRVFDFDDSQAKLDLAALTFQRTADKPGDCGFRVDMGAGQSLPEMTAARGLFRSTDTGEAHHFDVAQAYVSCVAALGRGLRFDLGKFYAPIGYESVERYDAYNDNATHSFLFGFTGPFTTTGLKISYPFTDKWSGMVMAVQGWDVVSDNNKGKSVGAQVVYAPDDAASFCLTYIGGPEQPDNAANWRNAYDLCATWKLTSTLSLGLNADYGHERDALGIGHNGRWYGAAAYLVYSLTERFQIALRGEQFDDPDGARTGTPQRLREITITPTYRIGGHFLVRADLRTDWSDQSSLQKDDRLTDRQPTASLNLILVY